MDECTLRAANGLRGIPCDGPSCVLWRVVGRLDLIEGADEDGCAVERFALLGARDRELAAWLLSVKETVDHEGMGELDTVLPPVEAPKLPN